VKNLQHSNVNLSLAFLFISGIALVISFGCKAGGPISPFDQANTPTPTPIVRIVGPLNVAVQDKSQAVTGLTVLAIPPSGATTLSQATTTTGIATFNPPYLEIGNWTFVVPAQTPYPFAPSTITMGVSQINQTATFTSAPATIELTPPASSAFTGTNGGQFIYGMNYIQPGNLWVPVTMKMSALNTGWSGGYGPTTIGFSGNDSGTVTVTGSGCVDQAQSFAVTALDLAAGSLIRANSAPQTIARSFTSSMTVQWVNSSSFSNISSCNLEKKLPGTLVVSGTNSCGTVSVYMTECNTNCFNGSFQTPNGTTNAQNAGGGSITFSPGSYPCTVWADGCFATLHATCSKNGASGSVQCSGSGTQTILSTSY